MRQEPDINEYFMKLPGVWQEHSRRVAKATAYFFDTVSQDELYEEEWVRYTAREIEEAVRYHDIGLLQIPGALTKKKSRLPEAERMKLRSHTICGAGMIEEYRRNHSVTPGQARILRLAAETAIGHHECWNGKGYPYGALATAIPLISRITAITHYYDIELWMAGCTSRTPHPARSETGMKEAQNAVLLQVLTLAGTQFDPRLAEKFGEICREFEGFQQIFEENRIRCVEGFQIWEEGMSGA